MIGEQRRVEGWRGYNGNDSELVYGMVIKESCRKRPCWSWTKMVLSYVKETFRKYDFS